MDDSSRRARDFAIGAHGDQRYGDRPYVEHLDEVAAVLRDHGHGDCVVAGYLHDVLEDTAITAAELEAEFGGDVAAAVAFCSDEPGPSRAVRKKDTYARMARDVAAAHDWIPLAIRTKVADRLANTAASADSNPGLLAKYRGEHPSFRRALFVVGVCDSMWRALDALISSPKRDGRD